MSHHSSDTDDLKRALLGDLPGQKRAQSAIDGLFRSLGATESYPEGVLSKTDQGGLKMAIMSKDDKIILAFGKEVAWIGFNPSDEREQERRSKL